VIILLISAEIIDDYIYINEEAKLTVLCFFQFRWQLK